MTLIVGIDPGQTGAICSVAFGELNPTTKKLSKGEWQVAKMLMEPTTLVYYLNDLQDVVGEDITLAVLERPSGAPPRGARCPTCGKARQGTGSLAKFATGVGRIEGVLAGMQIPYQTRLPPQWMKTMQCMTKGDKKISTAAARRLFPKLKFPNYAAEAVLICEYARRLWVQQETGSK